MAGPQNTTDLKTLVQKMIDEGAGDDVIHEVVTRYKSATTPGTPVSKDEPDTWWGGFFHALRPGGEAGQAGLKGAAGFATGLPSGVVSGAKALAMSPLYVLQAAIDAAGGVDKFQKDPVTTLTEMKKTVAGAPDALKKSLDDALTLASQDPKAFGHAVGQVTGQVEGGLATGMGAGKLVGAVAPELGAGLARAGNSRLASGLMYMEGGKQLASGNPMGLVTMAAPHIMKHVGEGIVKLSAPTEEAGMLSAADRMSLLKQGMTPDRIATLEAQMKAETTANAAPKPSVRVTGQAPKYPIRPAGERSTLTDLVGGAPDVAGDAVAAERLGMTPEQYAGWKADRQARINTAVKPAEAKPATETVPAAADTGTRSAPVTLPEGAETAAQVPPTPAAPPPSELTAEEKIGILSRGKQMGDRTVANLKKAGYDVPESGTFRSPQDIDRLLSGPSGPTGSVPEAPSSTGGSPQAGSGADEHYYQAMMNQHVPADLTHEGQAAEPGEMIPGPEVKLGAPNTNVRTAPPTKGESVMDTLTRNQIREESPHLSDTEVEDAVRKEREYRNNLYRAGAMNPDLMNQPPPMWARPENPQ